MKSIRLTHTFVKTVTRPGRYGDGRGGLGLSVLVKENAAGGLNKTWSQRLRIGRKIATLGLGSFPVVTLADARKRVLDNARRVYHGEDILKPPPIIPTVDEAFDIVIEQRRPSSPVARTPPTPASASRSTNPSTGTYTRSAAAAATVSSEASITTTHQTWSKMDPRRAEPR